MLIEVRHACQTLWYHPHGSPSIPFFSNIKPITILQTHRAIYAAGPLNRFSPQLEYLSHSIAQIHLSHFYPFIKRNLTFFFLKQILNHPRVVEESQLCKRFLSGVLAFTTYTHTPHHTPPLPNPHHQFSNNSQTDLPVQKPPVASYHIQNKIQLLNLC